HLTGRRRSKTGPREDPSRKAGRILCKGIECKDAMNPETKDFGRPDADNLVRLWNLFYQRTVAYAFGHPAAQEAMPRVFDAVSKCLGQSESLAILFQEFGYYIRHVDLVYQPKNRKLAESMRRCRVASRRIAKLLTLQGFSRFLDACTMTHADPARYLAYLVNQGVTNFAVNKVSLQTVKDGDSVVSQGGSRMEIGSDSGESGLAWEPRAERS